ncbi:MAG: hypothetical protein JJK57_12960 [Komagataeibacter hansenii]|nr:hypothetical protein [Novacetimonas hansenii]
MSNFVALLTAFGLGSIVSALIQARVTYSTKEDDRKFDEKQKAFIGLLEAFHKAASEGNDDKTKSFWYWQIRCDLVASKPVRDAISRIVETNDDLDERIKAVQNLKNAMRKDLGIAKTES